MPKSNGSTDNKKKEDGNGPPTNAPSTDNQGSELKKSSKSSGLSKEKKASGETVSKDGSGKGKSVRPKKAIKAPDEDKFDKLVKEIENEKKKNKEKKTDNGKKSKKYNLDVTQWENTEWKSQYDNYKKGENPADEKKKKPSGSKPKSVPNPSGTSPQCVPGENLQEAKEKSEYLLEFPLLSLIFSGVEFILHLGVFVLAIVAADGHIRVVTVFLVNSVVLMVLTLASSLIQFRRWHVKRGTDLNGHADFTIKHSFRRVYACSHLSRFWISFASTSALLYYIANGDQSTEKNDPGFYSQSPTELIIALMATILAEFLILVHIFFFFKNRMTITSCKR